MLWTSFEVDYEELPAVFDPNPALQEGAPLDSSRRRQLQRTAQAAGAPDQSVRSRRLYARRRAMQDSSNPISSWKILSPCREFTSLLSNRIVVWCGSTSASAGADVVAQQSAARFERKHGAGLRHRQRKNSRQSGGHRRRLRRQRGAHRRAGLLFARCAQWRPVKMVMEYREEFFAGAPRHAAIMKLKTGVEPRRHAGRPPNGCLSRCRRLRRLSTRRRRRRYRPCGRLLPRRARAHFGLARLHEQSSRRADARAGRAARVFRRGVAHGLRRAQGRHGSLRVPHEELIEEGDITLTGGHYKPSKPKRRFEPRQKPRVIQRRKENSSAAVSPWVIADPAAEPRHSRWSLAPDGAMVIHTSFFEQGTGTYTTLDRLPPRSCCAIPTKFKSTRWTRIPALTRTRVSAGAAARAWPAARRSKRRMRPRRNCWRSRRACSGWPKNEIILKGKNIRQSRNQRSSNSGESCWRGRGDRS